MDDGDEDAEHDDDGEEEDEQTEFGEDANDEEGDTTDLITV